MNLTVLLGILHIIFVPAAAPDGPMPQTSHARYNAPAAVTGDFSRPTQIVGGTQITSTRQRVVHKHIGQPKYEDLPLSLRSPRDVATGQASGKRQHRPITINKERGASNLQMEPLPYLLSTEISMEVDSATMDPLPVVSAYTFTSDKAEANTDSIKR